MPVRMHSKCTHMYVCITHACTKTHMHIIYNNKWTYHVPMFNVFITHRVANLDTYNCEIASPHMSLCMHIISSYTNTYFIYVYYVPMGLFSYSFMSFRFVSFHSFHFIISFIHSFLHSVSRSVINFIHSIHSIHVIHFIHVINFIHSFISVH